MTENWLSIHIFYTSNADPMLAECIQPLVAELRHRRMIQRYFFIKYWLEGPHVRLRLLQEEGVRHDQIRAVVEPAISAFLKRRPALYEQPTDGMDAFYKKMFIAEYGEEAWLQKYGENGVMPLTPTNSLKYADYEPEYDRYGGALGIEVAEWHFERSSDVVLKLLCDANVHVRAILLGLSTQLALPMCYVFLGTDEKVLDFLAFYMDFWHRTYSENSTPPFKKFDKAYHAISTQFRSRIAHVRQYVLRPEQSPTTQMEGEWLQHLRELRDRVVRLHADGQLIFSQRRIRRTDLREAARTGASGTSGSTDLSGSRDPGQTGAPLDVDTGLRILLSSYLHMTNNRLGVSILDEIYLAHLLRKAVSDVCEQQRDPTRAAS
jgi:hypothetical protein